MTNVIHLRLPCRQTSAERISALTASFAHERRGSGDVFWLKENAELLNILETTRPQMSADALAPYHEEYARLPERLQFFPQYYRFLLGLCLDLEDLGLGHAHGETLCDWVQRQGFAEAELSDLQRAEARRLLSRRIEIAPDPALEARLRAFANRSETFALPNKKAAYELTHIVFYLSEYGRKNPDLDKQAIVSLEYAGLPAYLDQNIDLLAEICIALRFAGARPSAVWEDRVSKASGAFVLDDDPVAPLADAYHEYLVTSWWSLVTGRDAFPGPVPEGATRFRRAQYPVGPLRDMSELMFRMGSERSADWGRMRDAVANAVDETQYAVLVGAERSTDRFGAFFEAFARA